MTSPLTTDERAAIARAIESAVTGDLEQPWLAAADAVLALSAPAQAQAVEWQDISTAPKMKNIILFAVTDVAEDGRVRNWKMDTGYWSSGAECWTWSGYQVRKYDIQPTHWQHLGPPPAPLIAEQRGET